jgi:hypothetical protein
MLGLKLHLNIDVTLGTKFLPQDRTEQRKASDVVLPAKSCQPFPVYMNSCHDFTSFFEPPALRVPFQPFSWFNSRTPFKPFQLFNLLAAVNPFQWPSLNVRARHLSRQFSQCPRKPLTGAYGSP